MMENENLKKNEIRENESQAIDLVVKYVVFDDAGGVLEGIACCDELSEANEIARKTWIETNDFERQKQHIVVVEAKCEYDENTNEFFMTEEYREIEDAFDSECFEAQHLL